MVRIVASGTAVSLSSDGWVTLAYLVVRGPDDYAGVAVIALTEATVENLQLESIAGSLEVLEPIPGQFDLAPSRHNPDTGVFTIEYRIPEGISREVEIPGRHKEYPAWVMIHPTACLCHS